MKLKRERMKEFFGNTYKPKNLTGFSILHPPLPVNFWQLWDPGGRVSSMTPPHSHSMGIFPALSSCTSPQKGTLLTQKRGASPQKGCSTSPALKSQARVRKTEWQQRGHSKKRKKGCRMKLKKIKITKTWDGQHDRERLKKNRNSKQDTRIL